MSLSPSEQVDLLRGLDSMSRRFPEDSDRQRPRGSGQRRSDLRIHRGAGDGNRTRVLSLGS